MRVTRSAMSLGGLFTWMGLCVAAVQSIGGGMARADSKAEKPDSVAVGYEIFNREWLPNDPRSHGGDGLGPVYNDSSCVACHNSGGSGGAGPVSKNIDILNASRNRGNEQAPPTRSDDKPSPTTSANELTNFHAGFRTSRTVVLHKFGIDPNYDAWRSQTLSSAPMQGVTSVADNTVARARHIRTGDPPWRITVSVPLNRSRQGQRRIVNKRRSHRPRDAADQSGTVGDVREHRFQPAAAAGGWLVRRQPVAAQPDAAFRTRADRRHPGRGDPGIGETAGQRIARDSWTGQPTQGRPDRTAGLERPDRQRRRLCPECLCGRGWSRGSRPSSGHDTASTEVSCGRARPDDPRNALPWSATCGACPSRSSFDRPRLRTVSISIPAGRPSQPSAVRIATRPIWAMSRGFTATCSSTIWVRRWVTKVRMADNTSRRR